MIGVDGDVLGLPVTSFAKGMALGLSVTGFAEVEALGLIVAGFADFVEALEVPGDGRSVGLMSGRLFLLLFSFSERYCSFTSSM